MENSTLNILFKNAKNIVNSKNQPMNANFMLMCEGQNEETGYSQNP